MRRDVDDAPAARCRHLARRGLVEIGEHHGGVSRANRIAVAAPMPLPAPVTMAILPESLCVMAAVVRVIGSGVW